MNAGHDAGALVERVERGELRREALELLSLVGHGEARLALGRLALELRMSAPVAWPEDDPPRQAASWEGPARWLQQLGRPTAVQLAVGLVDTLRAELLEVDEPPRKSHVALHTGPTGILHVTESVAAEVFPLGAKVGRAADGARAWLADPEAQATLAWPSLLLTRKRVELCSELAGVDWRAVWACRWLVACVTGRETEVGAAAATVAAYAHAALETTSPVYASVLAALSDPVLS